MISHLLAIFGSFVAGVWLATVINDRRWRDRLATTDPEALDRLDREDAAAARAADEDDAADIVALHPLCGECGEEIAEQYGDACARLCGRCAKRGEAGERDDDETDPLERNYR